MRLALFILVLVVGKSYAANFVVVAPNVMHYDEEETVSVSLEGNAPTPVTVSLKDWPDKKNEFSRVTKQVTGHSKEFKMKVSPNNFPDTERLKEGDRRYVFLVAKVGNVEKTSTVLVSGKSGMVYVQTDKPIYTPMQKVKIRVYTTDFNNAPKNLPIQLDIVTPQGIIVDRKEAHSNEQGVKGYMAHDFEIDIRPITGNWSVVAGYGHEYAYNTTVIFEVQKYVLPTFSCKIEGKDDSGLPNFVLLDENKRIQGRVVAQYSHGKNVKGSALVRIGITKADDTLIYKLFKLPLTGGRASFSFDTDDDILKRIPLDVRSHVIGEGIHIEADCYEWGTGMHMRDVNSQIIFTDSPFKFDFEKTKKYFKPGMPLVFQFQLYYVNGRPAPGREVKINAEATLNDGTKRPLTIDMKGGDGSEYITTREKGRGRMVYSTESHMKEVTVEFEVKYDEDGRIKANEKYVMKKYDAAKDVAIKIEDKIFRKGDNLEIDVFFKGTTFTDLTILVLARGQIVYADKPQNHQWVTNAIINIPLDSRMIPSARVFVFFTQDGVVGGDSLWIDLEDSCADNDVVKLRTSKEKYIHNGKAQTGTLVLEGSPSANVLVQMVDHAVLILNGRVTLSRTRMFQQLEELDLGCGGGGGKSSSETFQMAGLSVATTLKQNNDLLPLETGWRMLETCDAYNHGRNKRSLQDVRMSNLSNCCQMGKDAGARVDGSSDITCHSQLNVFLWSHSPTVECTKEYKQCCQNVTGDEEDKDDTVESAERSSQESTKEILDLAPSKIGVRRKFPESKVFDVLKLDEDGYLNHDFKIPDAITKWSVEAVQLSQNGFCVADTHDFTVWKDAFLKINLPYHAVKGEHLLAKATMYNFGDYAIRGQFYMKGVKGLCSNAPDGGYTHVEEKMLNPGEPAAVSWPIVPTEAGTYTITFYVLNDADNKPLDIVEKELTVIHEGLQSGTTISYAMDPTKDTHAPGCNKDRSTLKCYTELVLPRSSVPGSATGVLSVTGNLFGPAANIVADPNSIQKHMHEPAGCGEQVMIRVAPGVFAYSYLNSHTVPAAVEKTFPAYVKRGVNAISQYRKGSGGFGVWTTTPESTWLTSFVLKVFAKAYELAQGSVDKKNFLEPAVNFLYSKQITKGNSKGKFAEHTKVARHHGSMIGAVKDSDLTLTSHVLISLLESKTENPLHVARHGDTVNYLVKNVKSTTSSYEKALVAYALSLTDNPYRIIAYKRLQSEAKEELKLDAKVRYFPERSPKIQVETAAYAVLAALQHSDWDYCYDIVIWLHTQRRANKMFQTTQDTVIALQALAEYAVKTRRDRNDLKITIKSDDDTKLEEYVINNDNVDREFLYRIPEDKINVGRTVVIEASGAGQAQVSTEIMYHVYRKETCSFYIDLDLDTEGVQEENNNDRMGKRGPGQGQEEKDPKKRMNLQVCVGYNKEGATEMAIIEVGLLTGYEAETGSLDILVLDDTVNVDEYETTHEKVILYVTKIDEEERCYQFSAIQEDAMIGGISPAAVKVYDYYNPDEECSILYTEEEKDDWRVNFDKDDNVCYEGICGSCFGRMKGYKRPKSLQQFKNVVCSPSVSYVLKLEYQETDMESDTDWIYYYMKVDHPLKLGEYEVRAGETVRLAKRNQCSCPDIDTLVYEKNAKYFLLYGKLEQVVDVDNDESIYQLVLDRDAYLEPWNFHRRGPHRALRKFLGDGCKI